MAHPSVDVYVDTTDTIDKKIAALQCHVSQIPDPAGLDERIREWGAGDRGQRRAARGPHAPRPSSPSTPPDPHLNRCRAQGTRLTEVTGARSSQQDLPRRAGVRRLPHDAGAGAEHDLVAERVERVGVDVAVDPVGDPLERSRSTPAPRR